MSLDEVGTDGVGTDDGRTDDEGRDDAGRDDADGDVEIDVDKTETVDVDLEVATTGTEVDRVTAVILDEAIKAVAEPASDETDVTEIEASEFVVVGYPQ